MVYLGQNLPYIFYQNGYIFKKFDKNHYVVQAMIEADVIDVVSLLRNKHRDVLPWGKSKMS